MWYVYILRSRRDEMFYTGYTENLERRLREHEKGYVASTARRRPFTLLHVEEYSTKGAASAMEKFLKSGQGRKQLRMLLARGER